MLHAAAHQALGTALAFEEDATAAIAELRKAVRHWTEAEAPFEAAQARRSLGVAHRAAGDEASAVMELKAAKAAFEGLGARLGGRAVRRDDPRGRRAARPAGA